MDLNNNGFNPTSMPGNYAGMPLPSSMQNNSNFPAAPNNLGGVAQPNLAEQPGNFNPLNQPQAGTQNFQEVQSSNEQSNFNIDSAPQNYGAPNFSSPIADSIAANQLKVKEKKKGGNGLLITILILIILAETGYICYKAFGTKKVNTPKPDSNVNESLLEVPVIDSEEDMYHELFKSVSDEYPTPDFAHSSITIPGNTTMILEITDNHRIRCTREQDEVEISNIELARYMYMENDFVYVVTYKFEAYVIEPQNILETATAKRIQTEFDIVNLTISPILAFNSEKDVATRNTLGLLLKNENVYSINYDLEKDEYSLGDMINIEMKALLNEGKGKILVVDEIHNAKFYKYDGSLSGLFIGSLVNQDNERIKVKDAFIRQLNVNGELDNNRYFVLGEDDYLYTFPAAELEIIGQDVVAAKYNSLPVGRIDYELEGDACIAANVVFVQSDGQEKLQSIKPYSEDSSVKLEMIRLKELG